MIGRHIVDVLGECAYARIRPYIDRALQGERSEFEVEVPYEQVGTRVMHCSYEPNFDSSGTVLDLVATIIDVTEQRHAERAAREHARVTDALHKVGRVIASDLDQEHVAQTVTDIARELTEAEFCAFFYNLTNDSGEAYQLYTLSGAPREAFAKFPMPRSTALFGPTFRGDAAIRVADVLADPRYGRSAPDYGIPPGHLPVRSYLAVPVRARSGAVLGGLFFGDSKVGRFTEWHEELAVGIAYWAAVAFDNACLYREARTALKSARTASRLKDEFLAMLSHELRTPLNAVLGWAHMLQEDTLDAGTRERALQSIERNATHQIQLVNDLLDVSGIIGGNVRLNRRPLLLRSVVEAALDTIRPIAADNHLHLLTELAPDALVVEGDPGRLEQVVSNLLTNAVKFTPDNGRVVVRLTRDARRAVLMVEDSGRGIAPSFLPHVWEPFRQADSSRMRHGLGLGLAIVKHFTEAHGGSVEATSEGPGRGSTFMITLPLAEHPEVA